MTLPKSIRAHFVNIHKNINLTHKKHHKKKMWKKVNTNKTL